jgi:hypothetical protein
VPCNAFETHQMVSLPKHQDLLYLVSDPMQCIQNHCVIGAAAKSMTTNQAHLTKTRVTGNMLIMTTDKR